MLDDKAVKVARSQEDASTASSARSAAADQEIQELKAQKELALEELDKCRARKQQLISHFKVRRFFANIWVVLDGMPRELGDWLCPNRPPVCPSPDRRLALPPGGA